MIFAVVMCYPHNNHVLTIKRDIAGMYVFFVECLVLKCIIG